MTFHNSMKMPAGLELNNNPDLIPRYVHKPVVIEDSGVQAAIHENGKITLTEVVDDSETEFGELEVPAKFVFNIAGTIRTSKNINYVGTRPALVVEYNGIHASIQDNRVSITKVAEKIEGSTEVEYDEIEVSTKLIFDLVVMLRSTRTLEYVKREDIKK